ncbi:MAG: TRZ/ATZ family hydrolase, partial [Reinekea forsetii]|nr:TRZ/ATZ family hydrolase [Reinekea forsetii]
MQKIDTLISARWVIPVNQRRDVLDHHSVAIANGAIIAILPTSEAVAQYAPNEHVELADQALIPGFVNTHGHAAMALF